MARIFDPGQMQCLLGNRCSASWRLRDVLDATHGHAGQIHLEQRLLDGRFTTPTNQKALGGRTVEALKRI